MNKRKNDIWFSKLLRMKCNANPETRNEEKALGVIGSLGELIWFVEEYDEDDDEHWHFLFFNKK